MLEFKRANVADLAERIGLPLIPWQRFVLDDLLCVDDEDLNYKIAIEQQYQGWKSSVDIYRDGLTDNVKIAVAKAYFDKGLTTARSMAQYFNIPVTSAHYLISDIKNTLKSIRLVKKHVGKSMYWD